MNGQVVKTQSLSKDAGRVALNIMALASRTYNYTLYVDGQPSDKKRLVIVRSCHLFYSYCFIKHGTTTNNATKRVHVAIAAIHTYDCK